MDEKQLRQYVDCGLVNENEYELFSQIMRQSDPKTQQERNLALILFYYTVGDCTKQEYEQARRNLLSPQCPHQNTQG